jgi:hypothetical protein
VIYIQGLEDENHNWGQVRDQKVVLVREWTKRTKETVDQGKSSLAPDRSLTPMTRFVLIGQSNVLSFTSLLDF